MKNAVQILLILVIAVCGLGSFGAWLDSFDNSEEWAVSQSLIDAQVASQQDHRKQKAAQDLCLATIGESSAAWTVDGELICEPRKARKQPVSK